MEDPINPLDLPIINISQIVHEAYIMSELFNINDKNNKKNNYMYVIISVEIDVYVKLFFSIRE